MDMVDAHVHMDSIERAGLEAMALTGIKAVIADAAPLCGIAPAWQTVIDFTERTLTYDTIRGAEFFIDVYVMVGINMFFVSPDCEKIFEVLPDYLNRAKVVGIGEIGMDPRSETLPDLAKQKEIVTRFLKMAKQYKKVVLLHTPSTDRKSWVEKYFKLIDEAKLDHSKVIISHADSSILKMITDSGCIAGITVQPWRNFTPEDAAKMLETADLERVVLESDSSLRFGSDVLGVPKAALEMRKLGFKNSDIKRVVYDNAVKVFNLKLPL